MFGFRWNAPSTLCRNKHLVTILLGLNCLLLWKLTLINKQRQYILSNNGSIDIPVVNIGLVVQATGSYAEWTKLMVDSARKNFVQKYGYKITIFIFTDRLNEIAKGSDIVGIYRQRIGWPFDSMLRSKVYLDHFNLFKNMDYLFQTDADMTFVNPIGTEILNDLVGAQHYGKFRKSRSEMPFENRTESLAYVNENEGWFYVCGAFYGGKKNYVFKLWKTITQWAESDLKKNITPIWHDESYLNKYFVLYPPSTLLSSAYCIAEGKGKLAKNKIQNFNRLLQVSKLPISANKLPG